MRPVLNPIWLFLLLFAVLVGGFTGHLGAVTAAAAESAKDAVMSIALPLAGWFALWLGMMRLAELAGLVNVISRLLRPLMRRLFPDIPAGHPALGAMAMNMAANMLGLGNAATPLGLKAMKHLETLNRTPGLASNAMCTFLAINTASIQLIPATAIGILAVNGSSHPAAIVPSALMATLCAFSAGLGSVKLLEKLPRYQLPPAPASTPDSASSVAPDALPEPLETAPEPRPVTRDGYFLLALYALAMAAIFGILAFPEQVNYVFACLHLWVPKLVPVMTFAPLGPELARLHLATRLLSVAGLLALPFAFSFFPLYAWLRGVKVYEEFVEGAREGFQVATRIIPFLVAILVAVGMFRKAGGIDLLAKVFGPALGAVGFPVDLLPIALVRPLSGSATTGIFTEIVHTFGPDSMQSLMAGTIFGSTETTFYVLAVYFGSVGIRKTRHAVLAGLTADTVGVIASIAICRLLFA
jgi:spore maturation protein SpmA